MVSFDIGPFGNNSKTLLVTWWGKDLMIFGKSVNAPESRQYG